MSRRLDWSKVRRPGAKHVGDADVLGAGFAPRRAIKARFHGACLYCPRPIRPGQRIIRTGEFWLHAACARKRSEVA